MLRLGATHLLSLKVESGKTHPCCPQGVYGALIAVVGVVHSEVTERVRQGIHAALSEKQGMGGTSSDVSMLPSRLMAKVPLPLPRTR